MIEFRHVTKRFADGTVAVHDLSLVAPSHAITVLVGPSGCGKTTSLRMVNRMIDPSDGSIFASIARGTAADIDDAVRAAREAREHGWGGLAPAERGRCLARISAAITEHAE